MSALNIEDLIFREVQLGDACFLTCLMEQLGYPIDENEMKQNIQKYIPLAHQKTWVAEKSGKVVGCIAIAITDYFHCPGSLEEFKLCDLW